MNNLTAGLRDFLNYMDNAGVANITLSEIRANLLAEVVKIEAALDAERWVSVEERLPPEGDSVLAVHYGNALGVTEFVAYVDADGHWWDIESLPRVVTHWRPLPKFEVENAND